MFTGEFLSEIRNKALRHQAWYNSIDRFERGILSLSIRVIDSVKSSLLNIQLVDIRAKIREAHKSSFMRRARAPQSANQLEDLPFVTPPVLGSRQVVVYACIPALNEGATIGSVILQTKRYVDHVFVCDDGSFDLTGELAIALGASVVRHEANRGKGASLRDLFKEVLSRTPDAVVVLDADGQHDPSDIPAVLKPILSGEADMVIGSRYLDGSKTDAPLYRRFGLRFFNSNLGNWGVRDIQSGFRAYTTEALTLISDADANGFGVETEQVIIAKKWNLRVVEVPIKVRYNGIKKPSKMNPLFHGIDLIMTVIRIVAEERPLTLLGIPGLIFFVLGLSTGVMFFFYWGSLRFFSFPLAILMLMGVALGGILGVAAMILYSLSRLKK